MRVSSLENRIFFNKYKPDKKIGEGSFGKIYLSHNINTGEKFALKLENRNLVPSLLEQEAYILCYLKGEGIPFIKSFGISTEYNVLVMELLGKSLEYLFEKKNNKFSLKTVCMLGIQMITRLQYIHNKHILHRDIKPDNFIMGLDNNSWKVYLIDFGLSKKYRSSKTLKHIKFAEHKKLIGTARYASINALAECEQGRRDDMEALGYVLMYFLKGNLPWQGLKINKREDRYRKIYEKKKETTAEELCKGFPKEFCEFVKYTRKLEFEEEPDYDYLRNLLKQVMKDKNYEMDYIYDWVEDKKSIGENRTTTAEIITANQSNFSNIINEKKNNNKNIVENNNNIDNKKKKENDDVNNNIIKKKKSIDKKNNKKEEEEKNFEINNDKNKNNINNNVITNNKDNNNSKYLLTDSNVLYNKNEEINLSKEKIQNNNNNAINLKNNFTPNSTLKLKSNINNTNNTYKKYYTENFNDIDEEKNAINIITDKYKFFEDKKNYGKIIHTARNEIINKNYLSEIKYKNKKNNLKNESIDNNLQKSYINTSTNLNTTEISDNKCIII
jgi:serine/threonine protein kinase